MLGKDKMSSWKNSMVGKCLELQWISVTAKLRDSGYNLNIPIVPAVKDVEEERTALRKRIFDHYNGNASSIAMFSVETGINKVTLYRILANDPTVPKGHRLTICQALGIKPEEEAEYFD